jgi:xanthine phosphoribosyltransferase
MTVLMISPEYLGPRDRVLVIDDFLASGSTIRALVELVQNAGATLVGIGAVIEKRFEGGREALADLGVPVETLACIASMDNGKIVFDG